MPSIADAIISVAALLTGVDVKLGQEHVPANASPPRVVFVPRAERFQAASSRDRAHGHRSRATRAVGLEARIWAAATDEDREDDEYADLRATELLVDRVVIALDELLHGSIVFEDGEWADTGPAVTGRLYILRFRLLMPVVPTDEDATTQTTAWTEVLAGAGTPVGTPAAIETTVQLATDVTATPAP
jgi:hypothetical protein